jgi:hypothetical protein
MKYSFMLIGLSALWYLCSRLRRENDREGWVKIRNKTFHEIFFYNGYWEYRPCDIVGAVVSLGCFLAGVVTLILPLSEKVRALMLVGFGTLICLTEIPAIIYECWLIRKRRQKNDLAGRFLIASRNIKKDF